MTFFEKLIDSIVFILSWPFYKKQGFRPYAVYGCYLPLDSNRGVYDIVFINDILLPDFNIKNYIPNYEIVSKIWGDFEIESISMIKYLKLYWELY